jgi:hypothetical protein
MYRSPLDKPTYQILSCNHYYNITLALVLQRKRSLSTNLISTTKGPTIPEEFRDAAHFSCLRLFFALMYSLLLVKKNMKPHRIWEAENPEGGVPGKKGFRYDL